MFRRAALKPGIRKQNLLLALAIGSATLLLGCGGGGGGGTIGGGTQVCGSALGSTRTVVCGNVVLDGSTTPVVGATIMLKNASGTTLAQTTSRAGDGLFVLVVPSGATLIQIDPPNTTDYTANFMRYNGVIYGTNGTASAGGPCLPTLGSLPAGDSRLKASTLFSSAVPPPPYFGCPR